MSYGVVERVGVEGRVVVEDGHGGVVGEVVVVQHLEHAVAAHLQEGRPHAPDVFQLHAPVQVHDLSLTADLFRPVADAELLSVAVPAERYNKSNKLFIIII